MEIRTNNMIVITPKMNFLQIPIVDEYYNYPLDPSAPNRDKNFVLERGLLSSRGGLEAQMQAMQAEEPAINCVDVCA